LIASDSRSASFWPPIKNHAIALVKASINLIYVFMKSTRLHQCRFFVGLVALTIVFISKINGQNSPIELTFRATYQDQIIDLDSIYIQNLTQGSDTMLYFPDSVFFLDLSTSISYQKKPERTTFSIYPNYPNPFSDKTTFNVVAHESGHLDLMVLNQSGKTLVQYGRFLEPGNHVFKFFSGKETFYIISATMFGVTKTHKMISTGSNQFMNYTIAYSGMSGMGSDFKAFKNTGSFVFYPGDQLRFTGYATTPDMIIGNNEVEDIPEGSQIYDFNIMNGIRCIGPPAVTYSGQVYNTVKIGNQCWMAENLNVGTMINGIQAMSNNGIIEKYCFNDDPSNCDAYGGLYQWDEMMDYTTTEGASGICPPGWHIPTDEEWKVLEGAVDSQYNYPDPVWDFQGWRGHDAGINLRTTSGWFDGNNGTDMYGFSAKPGGRRFENGSFAGIINYGGFWTSSGGQTPNPPHRGIFYQENGVFRGGSGKINGRSVRCLKDNSFN
jgi:uncharacterized protein (TIGR02145 family)